MSNSSIDFFPFNANFFDDDKIAFVESEFGVNGSYIAIRLLCRIYGGEGYFCQWGPDECRLFARKLGIKISPSLVDEIVQSLVRRGFFSKAIFDKAGILTSRGIQKRFVEAKRRYAQVTMRRDLLLINVSNIGNIVLIGKDGPAMVEPGPAAPAAIPAVTPAVPAPAMITAAATPAVQREARSQAEEDSVEIDILSLFFFEKNFMAPQKQYRKLVNYNLTGRRNWRAMSAEQKMAAARMWQQRTDDGKVDDRRRFSERRFLEVWQKVFEYIGHNIPAMQSKFLDDGIRFERRPSGYCLLTVSGDVHEILMKRSKDIVPLLRPYIDEDLRLNTY